MGNLLGEPFKEYVRDQIVSRQKVYGKQTGRTLDEIQYLNSRNAWIKLASGASMDQERLDLLKSNPLVKNHPPGFSLALGNVLFNGLTPFGTIGEDAAEFLNQVKTNKKSEFYQMTVEELIKNNLSPRAGINGLRGNSNGAYGIGGTDFGYSPMPGIIDADIKDLNRGSIKKANLSIKAHNKNQFDVIDALYLRLGFTIMLEWGNNKYIKEIDSDGNGVVEGMGNTLIDKQFFKWNDSSYATVLPAIEEMREKYKGNYDGMFGVVSNFSWTLENDGSYSIKLEIISQGDIIESLKANLPPTDDEIPSKDLKEQKLADKNEYRKLALERLKTEVATNKEEFFNDLYPGLEKVLDRWWKEKNKEYHVGTSFNLEHKFGIYAISKDGYNFPKFDPGRFYKNENPKNQELIQGALMEGALRKGINYALNHSSNLPNFESNKTLSLKAYAIKNYNDEFVKDEDWSEEKEYHKHFYKWVQKVWQKDVEENEYLTKQILIQKNQLKNWGGARTEERFKSLIRHGTLRKIIQNNIDFEDLKQGIFEYFISIGRAGGENDPQFVIEEEDEDLSTEEQEEKDKEEQFQEELEEKKDKNKVFNYFYRIRKVWENKGKEFTFSKGITLDGKTTIGSIINPTGEEEGTLKPIWNTKVGFPLYPRVKYDDDEKKSYKAYQILKKKRKSKHSLGDLCNKEPNSADIIRLNIEPIEKQYYIRLGVFLEYLEQYVIPKIKTGDTLGQPMLLIDYHPENNICYIIDNVLSLNPNKMVIKNESFWDGEYGVKIFPNLKKFKYKVGGYNYGNIMNIYLNFDRIEEFFDGVDDKNQVNIYDILKNISKDINESLGNINNIEPIIDKDTNTVKFIDQTSIPGLETIANSLQGYETYNPEKEPTLEIFGYNNNDKTSNFIRSAGITTEISKEYASIISIGATAVGAIPGAESTAFSKWNIGIEDRFKTNIVDGAAERDSTLEEQNSQVLRKYKQMIMRKYNRLGCTSPKTGYLAIDSDVIDLNKNIAPNYYIYAQAESSNQPDTTIESSIGFIPFNLKLEMDGLSGIKIYNKVKVNTSFLPSNYGETLSFIATGVNHKLSGDEWVTSLDTIATTKSQFTKKK